MVRLLVIAELQNPGRGGKGDFLGIWQGLGSQCQLAMGELECLPMFWRCAIHISRFSSISAKRA